ncbi:MAG: LuxR C-terminal-related transcriptional regulator [Treponema sp.]|nr:LuxR C-terminal-related transcriptional regulator [Treponema sp.]
MFASKKKIEMWASCGDDFFYGLEGEEKDYSLAVVCYEKAAKKKHSYAAYMAGLCYELGGMGLRKNNQKAEEWYQKAAKLGNDYAEKRLASGNTFIPSSPQNENQEPDDVIQQGNDPTEEESQNLTKREQEIYTLLLSGTASKEIAFRLSISYPTVNFHINNIYRKLGVQSRAELFAKDRK